MFVLTQFNSASLNRHIKNTYHFSAFSSAFVDILAAEQTPDNPTWYQGTADAVRQSLRHLSPFESDYVLILSGDQLYQMDFQEMIKNHKDLGADISIATIPVADREAPEFGILKSNNDDLHDFIFASPFLQKLLDEAGQSLPNPTLRPAHSLPGRNRYRRHRWRDPLEDGGIGVGGDGIREAGCGGPRSAATTA